MDRDIPTFNHLIVNKIQKKNLQLHQRRLQNIKPTNNTRNNLSSSLNFRQNKKAEMLQQQKKTEIEKHNNMLFNKMMNIMKRTDPVNRPSNKQEKNCSKIITENIKLQEENRNLFERIDRQKPTINNKKLYEQRRKNLNILKFLGKYSPHSLQSTNNQSLKISQNSSRAANSTYEMNRKTVGSRHQHYLQASNPYQSHNFTKKERYNNQIEFDEEISQAEFTTLKNQFNERIKIKSVYEKMYQKQQNQPITSNQILKRQQIISKKITNSHHTIPRQAKDIILYKVFKKYKNDQYQIKIIRKHNSYEIQFFNIQKDQYKIMQYTQTQGNELLQKNQYNYSNIIDNLQQQFKQSKQLQIDENDQQRIDGYIDRDNNDYGYNMGNGGNMINNGVKNNLLRYNPSHISQLNQQQSYNPMVEQHDDRSPLPFIMKNDDIRQHSFEHSSQQNGDSLGQSDKQFINNYKKQKHNQYQFSINEDKDKDKDKQIIFKQKVIILKQQQNNNQNQRQNGQINNINDKNAQQYINIYQQALDQQII